MASLSNCFKYELITWLLYTTLVDWLQLEKDNLTTPIFSQNQYQSQVYWLYGLSGSGKSTLSERAQKILKDEHGYQVAFLDGDIFRKGLSKDLGFSLKDRNENLRRVAEVAKIMSSQGRITICSFITPLESQREMIQSILTERVKFIGLDCSLKTCTQRDPKGLYKKALSGEIPNFTGVSSPFEESEHSELIINTEKLNINQSTAALINFILKTTA